MRQKGLFANSFTLTELLVVIALLALLAAFLFPSLSRARSRARDAACLNNLKQWGLALQLYASDHDDYMPDEGSPSPRLGPLRLGWYVTLPRMLDVRPYEEWAWRTNPQANPGSSLFICPSNPRRATNNNLFHYCLNEHVDGSGASDRPTKIASISGPERVVYLFDNGGRAAVAQHNNVHTNLHRQGAHFLFLDAHAAHYRNLEYWDFTARRGRTNNPALVWRP